VWSETWQSIWLPLIDGDDVHEDIFCELFRVIAKSLKAVPSIEDLANVVDSPVQSRDAFKRIIADDIAGERALVDFFENVHEALYDLGGDQLANAYFVLLEGFIARFSLRYDLRRPCTLCPTVPGIFASLMRELRAQTGIDAHLDVLMKDFENSVRDLRQDSSDLRIKTCIQKQFNLLEAIGQTFPGVTSNTLGKICSQVTSWPHDKLKDSMNSLYGFACDYPGIRHGGTPRNARRVVDMRDLIAMSILLIGFTPYLAHSLVPDDIFGGGLVKSGVISPTSSIAPPGGAKPGIISRMLAALAAAVRK
jgi:hypothetical protein